MRPPPWWERAPEGRTDFRQLRRQCRLGDRPTVTMCGLQAAGPALSDYSSMSAATTAAPIDGGALNIFFSGSV